MEFQLLQWWHYNTRLAQSRLCSSRSPTRLAKGRARREVREGDRLLIEEPGRVIIQEGGQTIIRQNDADRFRWQARDVHIERRGAETVTVFERPDGSRIYTVTDAVGRASGLYCA